MLEAHIIMKRTSYDLADPEQRLIDTHTWTATLSHSTGCLSHRLFLHKYRTHLFSAFYQMQTNKNRCKTAADTDDFKAVLTHDVLGYT